MAVTKGELEKCLVQVRRIQEHREAGAEKEIRRLYKLLLKDLKEFIGYEYAQFAEDGRLTYEILQQKGEFARFLEEVEQKINGISPQEAQTIQRVVNETYEACYQGMTEAVKSTVGEELSSALKGVSSATPETIKRAVENPISGLTLKDTLEKNRREIIYGIKRDLSLGLANGDRVDTVAKRISKSLDGDYKKAVTTARTETHRVREAGFHDAAQEVSEALSKGNSGLLLVNTWRTMKDSRVRPQRRYRTKSGWKISKRRGGANHQKMDGVTVLVGEEFDLGDGVKTKAPGQSGVAGHDINCRCYLGYELMTIEEFLQNGGKLPEKTFTGDGNRGIIKIKNSDLPNGLPLKGEPNSIVDKTDDSGIVQQRRIYGADGMAKTDFDTTDHNRPDIHPTGAHKHEFDYSKRNPRSGWKALTESELKGNSDIIKRGENYHDKN